MNFNAEIVRRGSRGVVSWTCDPLGQRFDSYPLHAFILLQSPREKELTVHYLVVNGILIQSAVLLGTVELSNVGLG